MLFVRIQLLQAKQVMHSSDLIKRKALVGRNADASIRQLRRSLKLCITDDSCYDVLGTVYKEHAHRLLLGSHVDILKNRPLILRLLNKSLKLFMHSKEENRFEVMGEVLRWMVEMGLTSINVSPFSVLREERTRGVLVKSLQLTLAKASIAHHTQSPLTLITLAMLCPDDSVKLRFLEEAWSLSNESKHFQYFAAYKLIEMAYQLQRKDILARHFPEACQGREGGRRRLMSFQHSDPFIEAMKMMESLDAHSTQHAHTFFLATHSTRHSLAIDSDR